MSPRGFKILETLNLFCIPINLALIIGAQGGWRTFNCLSLAINCIVVFRAWRRTRTST